MDLQPQPQQPNISPVEPKKNLFAKHMIVGYVFLFAVLAAAVSVIYYWQTVRQIPTLFQSPVHKDVTADWKTINMTNAQIKIPPTWGIVNEESGAVSPVNGNSYSADSALAVAELGENPPLGFTLNIYNDTNFRRPSGQTFTEALVNLYELKNLTKTNINIGPYSATNYAPTGSTSHTITDLGDRAIDVFSYRIGLDTFKPILSTFKFTDHQGLNIDQIQPASGKVGTKATITGAGFSPAGNSIKFGGGYINDLSSDGTTIVFTVPDGLGVCKPGQVVCPMLYMQVTPGSYTLSVLNKDEVESNSLTFTVTK